MLREATHPPAAVNVLDVSSESMAAFQVFLYGRFCVFTDGSRSDHGGERFKIALSQVAGKRLTFARDSPLDR